MRPNLALASTILDSARLPLEPVRDRSARSGQPATYRNLGSAADAFGVIGCWAMFQDGSSYSGGIRGKQHRLVNYVDTYTRMTPIGRAFKAMGVGGAGGSTTIGTARTGSIAWGKAATGFDGATKLAAVFNVMGTAGSANQNTLGLVSIADQAGTFCRAVARTMAAGQLRVGVEVYRTWTGSDCFYSVPFDFKGVIAIVFDAGAWTVYANGAVVTPDSTTSAQTMAGVTSATELTFMPSSFGQASYFSLPPANLAAICVGPFGPDKVAAITANPWQLFAAPRRRVWVAGVEPPPKPMEVRRVGRVRTSQPWSNPRINWANPLTKGLKFLVVPSLHASGIRAFDLVQSRWAVVAENASSMSVRHDSVGAALRSAGDGGNLGGGWIIPDCPANSIYSAMAVGKYDSSTGRTPFVADTNADFFGMMSGKPGFVRSGITLTVADVYPANTVAAVAVRFQATNYGIGLNGAVTVLTNNNGTFLSGTTNNVRLGAVPPGYNFVAHRSYVAAGWGRFLSDSELAAITANPWQLFVGDARAFAPYSLPTELSIVMNMPTRGYGSGGQFNSTAGNTYIRNHGTIKGATVGRYVLVIARVRANVTGTIDKIVVGGAEAALVAQHTGGGMHARWGLVKLTSGGDLPVQVHFTATSTTNFIDNGSDFVEIYDEAGGELGFGAMATSAITDPSLTTEADRSAIFDFQIQPNFEDVCNNRDDWDVVNVYTRERVGYSMNAGAAGAKLFDWNPGGTPSHYMIEVKRITVLTPELEPRYGRPISTSSPGTWTATGAATHHEAINEVTPDDANYISVGAAGSVCRFKLTALGDPGDTTHTLMMRAASAYSNSMRVRIQQNTTTIATWDQAVTPTPAQYDFELTSLQRDSITDYTDLYLEIEGL